MFINFKNKKEVYFMIFGAILFSILAAFIYYSINFLVLKINAALDIESAINNQEIQRINFEGLKKIGIIKE
ncbi:hypothetical protein HZB04_01665 [Candidatus Wolfebacteria bacterium]|nr:hypothetical protein [Candidatus Wolfebacteria bacterium]